MCGGAGLCLLPRPGTLFHSSENQGVGQGLRGAFSIEHFVAFCAVWGPGVQCDTKLPKASAPYSARTQLPSDTASWALSDPSGDSALVTDREDPLNRLESKGQGQVGDKAGQKDLDRHYLGTATCCGTLGGTLRSIRENFAHSPARAAGEKSVCVHSGGLPGLRRLVKPEDTGITHTLSTPQSPVHLANTQILRLHPGPAVSEARGRSVKKSVLFFF